MKKKEKSGRKLLSLLLALAMVVGLLPGMGLTVRAESSAPVYVFDKNNHEYQDFNVDVKKITKIEALIDMEKIDENGWGQVQWGYYNSETDNDYHSVMIDNTPGIKKYIVEGTALNSARFAQVQIYGSARLLGYHVYYDTQLAESKGKMDYSEFTAPTAKSGLGYTGSQQALVTAGIITSGADTLEYSLDKSTWSTVIPKAQNAGDYTVYYRIKESNNEIYQPLAGNTGISVSIAKKNVTVTAKNQSICVNDTVPDLSSPVLNMHYSVTGLVGTDELTTAPTLVYQKNGEAVTPDNTTVGTYDIVPSGASASDNYSISYTNGTLTIGEKQAVTVTKVPEANALTYNGSAQALVTAGIAEGGEMRYALGTATEATQPYTTTIPTATNAGTYYVWYKAVGDENHNDSEAKSVEVIISALDPGNQDKQPENPSESVYTYSGTIITSDESPAVNALVSLEKDGESKASAATDANGKFTLSAAAGVYNLVVDYTGSDGTNVKVTKLVKLDDNKVDSTIQLPDGKKNSVLDNSKAGTLAPVVGGLDEIAKEQTLSEGETITVILAVADEENAQSGENATEFNVGKEQIRAMSETSGKTLQFFDLSLKMTKTDSTGASTTADIGGANTHMLEIVIPFDTSGKKDITMYRYHGNKSDAISAKDNPGPDEEYIEVGSDSITLHAKGFSTYAIGYTTTDNSSAGQTTTSSSSSGSALSTVSIADPMASEIHRILGVDAATAGKMAEIAKKYGITIDEIALTEDVITGLTTDEDPKGSTYYKLLARVTKRAKNSLTVNWDYLPYADGYMVFGARCNTKDKEYKFELLETIDENDITATRSFVDKNLKAKTYYKYMVVAYKNVGGKKMTVGASKIVHAPTKTAASTVAKKLKTSVSSVKLKVGGTKKLTTTEVKEDKGKKLDSHRKVMYESENPAIATVTKKGG